MNLNSLILLILLHDIVMETQPGSWQGPCCRSLQHRCCPGGAAAPGGKGHCSHTALRVTSQREFWGRKSHQSKCLCMSEAEEYILVAAQPAVALPMTPRSKAVPNSAEAPQALCQAHLPCPAGPPRALPPFLVPPSPALSTPQATSTQSGRKVKFPHN